MSNRKDSFYAYHKKPCLSMDYSNIYNSKPDQYISSYLVKKGPKIIEEPTRGYNFEEYFRVLPPHLYSRYYNSHKYLNQGKRYYPNLRLNFKRGLSKPSSVASSLVSTPNSIQCSRSPSPLPLSRPTSPINEFNNGNNRCLSPRNFHTLSPKTSPELLKSLNEKSRSLHSINCSKENDNSKKKDNVKKSHPLLLTENDETKLIKPDNLLEALNKNIVELTDSLNKFLTSESLKKKYCNELNIIEKVNQLKDVSQKLQEHKVDLDKNLSSEDNELEKDQVDSLNLNLDTDIKKFENAKIVEDKLIKNEISEDNSNEHKTNKLEKDYSNEENIFEPDQLNNEKNNFKIDDTNIKNADHQKLSDSGSQDEEFFECSNKDKNKIRKSFIKPNSNKLSLSQLIDKAIEEQILGQWLKLSDSIDDETSPIQNKNLIEKLKNKFSTKLAIIHYKLYQKYTKNMPIKNLKKWRHQKLNKGNKIQSKYTFLQGLMDDDRFVQFLMDKINYFMSKIKTCKTQRKESKNLDKILKEFCESKDNYLEKSLDSIDSKYSDENNNENFEEIKLKFDEKKLIEDQIVKKENLELLEDLKILKEESLNEELLEKELLIEQILEKENLEKEYPENLEKEYSKNLEKEYSENLEKEISKNLEKEILEKKILENLELNDKNEDPIFEEIIVAKKNKNETGFIDYEKLNILEMEVKYSEKNNLLSLIEDDYKDKQKKKKSYLKYKILFLLGLFILTFVLFKWLNQNQKCTTCNQGLIENKLILRPVESKTISNYEISCNHWIIMEAQKLLGKKKV